MKPGILIYSGYAFSGGENEWNNEKTWIIHRFAVKAAGITGKPEQAADRYHPAKAAEGCSKSYSPGKIHRVQAVQQLSL